MKKIKILSVVFALCVILTGCKENNVNPATPSTISNSESTFNSSSDSLSNDNSSVFASEPLSRTECEQIVMIFKAWGDLDYNIHPDQTDTSRPDYIPECVDASQFFTEEITRKGSIMTYTEYFYLISSGDFSTEEGFEQKLDEMFSEKFKERYMGSSWQMFRFKDGEAYVAGYKHYDENEPRKILLLNLERVDVKTVVLSVSDTSEDDAREYTATFLRSENGGFKIDEVGKDDSSLFMIPALFHYKNTEVVVNWQDNALFTL